MAEGCNDNTKDMIFFDHQATTPVDANVVAAMMPFFETHYGNYHSRHAFGAQARKACESARAQVAALVNASPEEIIFTSGATESNNLAIKGYAEAQQHLGRHIITCNTEHRAVLDTCAALEKKGFEITYLPVDSDGRLNPDDLQGSIRVGKVGTNERTILVSLMAANNEIGSLHPLADIIKITKGSSLCLHVDGAQFAGKMPLDLQASDIDLLSISGHKIYAPKGIGALFIRKSSDWKIAPQIHGGGQECGLRSGTVPVPLVVALGKACELAGSLMKQENKRLLTLRERLWQGLKHRIGRVTLNGHPVQRLPGNLNVTFGGVEAEFLAFAFKKIAVSSSSACSAGVTKTSHVLAAIGRSPEEAMTSVRFGIGRHNTTEEVDFVIDAIAQVYARYAKKTVGAQITTKSAAMS